MDNPLSYLELQSSIGNNAERFAYIDFKLRFTGSIKRSDLNDAFGLADASASRLLASYAEIKPLNFTYNRSRKFNVITEDYQPLVHIDPIVALGMLAHGFNKNKLIDNPILPYSRVGTLTNVLNNCDVARITRAMFNKQAIRCNYISSNSNNHSEREILPLSLLFDGRSWIFRAYERSATDEKKFKNYNFSRTTSVVELGPESEQRSYESLAADTLWNERVPLILALHPNLTEDQKKSVRRDFGMPATNEELILTERAALLWILQHRWFIDKREAVTEKNKQYYNFYFKNREMCLPYLP
jgi:hypothetical protein